MMYLFISSSTSKLSGGRILSEDQAPIYLLKKKIDQKAVLRREIGTPFLVFGLCDVLNVIMFYK